MIFQFQIYALMYVNALYNGHHFSVYSSYYTALDLILKYDCDTQTSLCSQEVKK